jgi:ElaB/YqjD/DUF883 family membrane-anchored ribosome-binding protein
MESAMTTATTRASNGAAREVKALSRRVSSQGRKLGHELSLDSAALTRRAGELIQSTTQTARNHPWTTASILVGAAALVGGLLWSRR